MRARVGGQTDWGESFALLRAFYKLDRDEVEDMDEQQMHAYIDRIPMLVRLLTPPSIRIG